MDEVIELIEKAQQPDGYLNVYFTVVDPEGRFKNLRDMHELCEHMLERLIETKLTDTRQLRSSCGGCDRSCRVHWFPQISQRDAQGESSCCLWLEPKIDFMVTVPRAAYEDIRS